MMNKERIKNWWINFRLRNFGIDYDWEDDKFCKNKADGVNFVFRNWMQHRLACAGVASRHHHPTAMYIDNMFESGPSTTDNLFYFMQLRIDLARAQSDPWYFLARFMRLSDDQIARLKAQHGRLPLRYGHDPTVDWSRHYG